MRSDQWVLPWAARQQIREQGLQSDYWKNAYHLLVKQTGRDLNDGLGLDPRKVK